MGSNSTAIPTTSVAELKYLSLLARDYPTQAAAASAVISLEATAKLPKGTEHFMSDLHGENEAFVHILNSASGVIREKVDLVLGDAIPEQAADFAAQAELAAQLDADGVCCRVSQLAVNGRDLMAAGIPAGPGLRRTLEALLDAVVRGQLPNEQQCLLDAAGQISAS